jgi:hypothetical protein
MRWSSYIAAITLIGLTHAPTRSQTQPLPPLEAGFPRTTSCPAGHQTVDIKASADPEVRRQQRALLIKAVARDSTTVRLGPDVDLDFSDLPDDSFPIQFGRCVTLTSVSAFHDGGLSPSGHAPGTPNPAIGLAGPGDTSLSTTEARSPHSLGPVLRYNKYHGDSKAFLEIRCFVNGTVNDGARISGFRLFGRSFGNQSTKEVGIHVVRCIDIEISNMEIAGWGGMGISVTDLGPDGPGGRIRHPDQIRIHDNHIHNNQHPNLSEGIVDHVGSIFCLGGSASGYGVETSTSAWARFARNVFDFNRHAISATKDTGGYVAEQNLVLKGGGYHGKWCITYTHIFDAHGSGCWWSSDLCGDAGMKFLYTANAFQYHKENAIKIRGKPGVSAVISGNIFPHDHVDGDAVDLYTHDNVTIRSDNVARFDSFGKYGVCDFDGDGVDDLFLATGTTWWFSSFGEFHWSYLNDKKQRLGDVRLGYFDGDARCDVLAEQDGQWVISSAGTGDWKPLGAFGALSDVVFGRFDPDIRDHRPNATRPTTHAFRRADDGQWFVTPLSGPHWQLVQSSSIPMSKLQFGDFNGDGVTDVLAVVNGRWAISESARGNWRQINATLGDPVGELLIANMDADDNIDDILRLERKFQPLGTVNMRATLTWWRSKNGIEPWQRWKEHVFQYTPSADTVTPGIAFAGRFGAAPGGGTLVIDQNRLGHFHSKAETAVGASPDWTSLFPY